MWYVARASIIVALLALIGGCVIVNDSSQGKVGKSDTFERNRLMIDRLQLGATLDAVVRELGDADITEAFLKDGRAHRVLYYRTHHASGTRGTTRGMTPLVFVDGQLIGWGQSTLDYVLH
jgi:hypothetical protein